jgi:hypothetical protein
MQLVTEISIPSVNSQITYNDSILAFGSCFAEHIGRFLSALHFTIDINPFGILYNPASISQSINRILEQKTFTKEELIERNGLWHSFAHHGQFSTGDSEKTLQLINSRLIAASERIKTCNHLLVTFGTAWIYTLRETDIIAANCHKFPEKTFSRKRLTVEDIYIDWISLIKRLEEINPAINILFTVSPIRHWRDGAHENQLSKSTLLLAIDQLQKTTKVSYFPAYELMMDELRDYRFYAPDMLHPSETAVEYIWERFSSVYFDTETKKTVSEVEKINKALQHRPLHPDSIEYECFKSNILEQIALLKHRYPDLRFTEEDKP